MRGWGQETAGRGEAGLGCRLLQASGARDPVQAGPDDSVRGGLCLGDLGTTRPRSTGTLGSLTPCCWATVIILQSLSYIWLFATPWTAAHQTSLSFTISQNLLTLMSIESVMPSNHLILCCPLLLLPSIFPSIRVSSSGSALHIRWPKYWSFSFSISLSNEYSGGLTDLISLLSKGLSRVFSNTTVPKYQFFGVQPSLWSNSHICTIDGEAVETVTDFILGGSKIIANGDCSHKIKSHLLLGRRVMTNLDSLFKSRDFTDKGPHNQSYGFSSSHVQM